MRTVLFLFVLFAAFPVSVSAELSRSPNFVFFLVDDLGYMDIGANNENTFYETPNIDSLAASGMRLTSAYAACPVSIRPGQRRRIFSAASVPANYCLPNTNVVSIWKKLRWPKC